MKNLLFPKANLATSSTRVSAGLLALRLVVGIAFILHGAGKIASPFNWMGPDAPVPGIFQALAALAEFGGGIGLIVGLLTPLVSVGLIATMAVAVVFHAMKGDGFVGGYELALVYLAVSVLTLLVGPGRFSLDQLISSSARAATSNPSLGNNRGSSVA